MLQEMTCDPPRCCIENEMTHWESQQFLLNDPPPEAVWKKCEPPWKFPPPLEIHK